MGGNSEQEKEKEMKPMTKKQLVKLINAYPGDPVTTRPKKSVLEEILRERVEDARMEEAAQAARQVEDANRDMLKQLAKDPEWGSTGIIALVAALCIAVAGLVWYF